MSRESHSKDIYQIKVSREKSDPEWDSFLAHIPGGSHYQTSMWGQTRALFGWQAVRVMLMDKDQIIAGGQWLQRAYPPLGKVAFFPKGPLTNPNCLDALNPLSKAIIHTCQIEGIQYLAVRPPDEGFSIAERLLLNGFRRSPISIFKAASIRIDLSPDLNQIFANIKKKNRQYIRQSREEGMMVRLGNEADLPNFYSLYTASSQRQGFTPEPYEYFSTLWQAFAPGGHIVLVLATYNDELVCGKLNIAFGDTVVAKYLGWNGLYNDHHPNDAIWWESIKWAKEHGYHYYDFDGIVAIIAQAMLAGPPFPDVFVHSSVYKKYLYGGQLILYPDSYDYVINPIARLGYKIFYPLLVSQSNNIVSLWNKIKSS